MVFGFSKTFIIFIIIAIVIGLGTRSWINFGWVLGCFVFGKILWNILR